MFFQCHLCFLPKNCHMGQQNPNISDYTRNITVCYIISTIQLYLFSVLSPYIMFWCQVCHSGKKFKFTLCQFFWNCLKISESALRNTACIMFVIVECNSSLCHLSTFQMSRYNTEDLTSASSTPPLFTCILSSVDAYSYMNLFNLCTTANLDSGAKRKTFLLGKSASTAPPRCHC